LLAQFECDDDFSGMLNEKNKDHSDMQKDDPVIHALLLSLFLADMLIDGKTRVRTDGFEPALFHPG